MDYLSRKPDFVVEVVRPDYESSTYIGKTIVQFISSESISASKVLASSTGLVSYRYNESLASVDSGFSLLLTLEEDELGQTWYDKIIEMDLVFITEFGESRFCGYVEARRYIAKMGADGKPERKISINGGSLGKLLSSFKLIIDQYLFQGTGTAQTVSQELKVALAQQMASGQQIAPIFEEIYKSFFKLVLEMGEVNQPGIGIKSVIDNFIDYTSGLSRTLVLNYPLNLSLYQVGENSIWDIWNQMVHPPIGELYGLWKADTKKYQLVFRQTPFESVDWTLLNINNIPSIIITDFDIGTSVDEIFTFYYVTLPGSGYDRNKALALAVDGYGFTPATDEVKWKKFGFRPLMVELRYFSKGDLESFTGAGSLITKLSNQLKEWYSHNDEFLSGKITMMTIDRTMWAGELNNPRIGERIKFVDAEFYVEESEHTWSYGGPMITSLSVSRGYLYDPSGSMVGRVNNLGSKAKSITKKVKT